MHGKKLARPRWAIWWPSSSFLPSRAAHMTRLQSTDSFSDVFTPTPPKMVKLPFRHEFELFSYSFICCKVFPLSFISACGLYFLFVFSLAALTRCFAVWHRASLTTPVLLVALKSTLKRHCTMIKAIQQHAHCGGRIKTFFSVGFFFFFFPNFFEHWWWYAYVCFLMLLFCSTLDFSLFSRWAPPIWNTVLAVTSY